MSHIHSSNYRPSMAVLVLVLASLTLAACGGSSTSSSSTAASATTSTSDGPGATGRPTGPGGAVGGRFLALRECLQKNGITLPKRKPGQGPSAGGFLGGGARQLPAGVTRAQYEAAVKKCGGFPRGRLPGGGARARFNSPVVKQALAKFAACMRSNGVNLGEPNTSGKGSIFNTKGLNTSSATFRAAEAKCRIDLLGAFRARPGAAGRAGGAVNG